MEDKKYWVGFNLIKGIGAVRMQSLIQHFGELELAWMAAPADLAGAGLGKKLIERVVQAHESIDLEILWAKIESQDIKILTWQDEAYPQRLRRFTSRRPYCIFAANICRMIYSRWPSSGRDVSRLMDGRSRKKSLPFWQQTESLS